MKCLGLAIAAVVLTQSLLWSQQLATIPPDNIRFDRGSITNGIYTNACFGLSFSIPQHWEVSPITTLGSGRALHLPGGGLGLLIIARNREKTFGDQIALYAKYDGKNSTSSVQSLVNATAEAHVKVNRQKREVIREAFALEYGGKHFYRADDKQTVSNDSTLYTAFVYTRFGEYLVGATVTAISPETLNEAVDSLRGLSFQREAPNPECVVGPDDGPLMGVVGTIRSSSAGLGTASRVRVSHMVSQGLLVKRVPPEYPEGARRSTDRRIGLAGRDGRRER